jgi:hypothetical protein
LARLAYAAASQNEAVASREAFEWAGEGVPEDGPKAPAGDDLKVPLVEGPKAPLVERVEAQVDSAIALQAEGKLARNRAERLRVEAEELKRRRRAARRT